MMSRIRKELVGRAPLERVKPGTLVALVAVLGVGFVAAVLVPGFELATELADTTAALRFVGEQQRYPDLIRTSLETVHDRLNARGYIEAPLGALRDASAKFEAAQGVIERARRPGWFDSSNDSAAFAQPSTAKRVASLGALWRSERQSLDPLLRFEGVPYQDNEATGTGLNDAGRALVLDVNFAIRSARRLLPAIDTELGAISADLQARNARSATYLRIVMLAGLAIAAVLLSAVLMLLVARRRQASSLRAARQQTEDILRTVKDGLFLLDRNLVIGSTYSAALEGLFNRKDFAGLAFENLLQGIVNERTLATARKFVAVLWSERTKENLVKSINPLGEVEVRITNSQGSIATRYLEFDFHRVRIEGKITHVLVSVSDITARVDLSRELIASQNQAQAQVDTLLGILHVDSGQLASFLSDSDASMKMINAVLREPAREEEAFRRKLDSLFRQAHSVKGEAASLGLSSIESRAHAFEDDLRALREKQELTGNDFLPLVLKLDDLLTHLQSISDLVSRLSRLHARQEPGSSSAAPAFDPSRTDVAQGARSGAGDTARNARPPNLEQAAAPADPARPDLAPLLKQLAERIGAQLDKSAALECSGFDAIPQDYRRLIKDIAVQAVRNSMAHGIETGPARRAQGKPATGAIAIDFQELPGGFKLTIEDDGQGISTERIKEVAVQRRMITQDQAAAMDTKQAFSLLFQAGFSMAERETKDAGRGVGMNLIAERAREAGGRVGVATAPGKFTRISVSLPPTNKRINVTEAA